MIEISCPFVAKTFYLSFMDSPIPKKPIDLSELLHGEIITSQALIDLLVEKGVITEEELFHKIKKLQAEIGKQRN